MKKKAKIFRRNKFKDLIYFFIAAIFVVAGYFMLEENPLIGWLSISFFGMGVMIFLIQLVTNFAYLKIDEEGFEERVLFRTKRFKWSNVKGFRKTSFYGNQRIVFDYTDAYHQRNRRSKFYYFLFGKQGSITSSHNIDTGKLLNLMKSYKRRSK